MSGPDSPPSSLRLRRALRLIAAASAVAYPLALAAIILAFRFIGERWWVTLTALYLPRVGFALPLPFVLVAAHVWAGRKFLALQVVSVLLLVFPLMGFSPGLGRFLPRPDGPSLRVLSFNVRFWGAKASIVAAEARKRHADIVLLQDASRGGSSEFREAFEGWHVRHDGEFALATRFPVRDVYVPPSLVYPQGTGGAHYVHYTLETPLGLVAVFNVHPTSPRPGLEEVRGGGLRDEVVSGRLFEGRARGPAEWNAFRRRRQVAGVAARANASTNAVIIAGDTNLPGLSWIFSENLRGYTDAFARAGGGFGYTFPSGRPWMRIDRILTNERLRALEFRVGDATPSDHLSVFAVLVPGR